MSVPLVAVVVLSKGQFWPLGNGPLGVTFISRAQFLVFQQSLHARRLSRACVLLLPRGGH